MDKSFRAGGDFLTGNQRQSADIDDSEVAQIRVVDIFDFHPDRRVDFIISSLFAHHLTDDEVIRFIRWMDAHAVQGWFINDLHRHPLPYAFIKCFTRLFGFNRLVQHDAPLSVARAFVMADWRRLLVAAGIPMERIRITWFFPFRYGIACHCTDTALQHP